MITDKHITIFLRTLYKDECDISIIEFNNNGTTTKFMYVHFLVSFQGNPQILHHTFSIDKIMEAYNIHRKSKITQILSSGIN